MSMYNMYEIWVCKTYMSIGFIQCVHRYLLYQRCCKCLLVSKHRSGQLPRWSWCHTMVHPSLILVSHNGTSLTYFGVTQWYIPHLIWGHTMVHPSLILVSHNGTFLAYFGVTQWYIPCNHRVAALCDVKPCNLYNAWLCIACLYVYRY
jgi:hypothetical protein